MNEEWFENLSDREKELVRKNFEYLTRANIEEKIDNLFDSVWNLLTENKYADGKIRK